MKYSNLNIKDYNYKIVKTSRTLVLYSTSLKRGVQINFDDDIVIDNLDNGEIVSISELKTLSKLPHFISDNNSFRFTTETIIRLSSTKRLRLYPSGEKKIYEEGGKRISYHAHLFGSQMEGETITHDMNTSPNFMDSGGFRSGMTTQLFSSRFNASLDAD